MWPLSIPSALKPGFAAASAQGMPVTMTASSASASSSSRTLSQRSRTAAAAAAAAAAHTSRFSLEIASSLLDPQRRSSLSAWPPSPSTLTSNPNVCSSTLLLEPFNLPWAFNLPTTPEPDFHLPFPFPIPTTAPAQPLPKLTATAPTQPQPQQVTRHNFHLALPLLTQALKDCTFFALDCEFSGLSPQAPHFSELYDDAADRYQRVLSSSKQFMVMQIGLSFFTKDPASPSSSTPGYISHTFNFSVFPKPFGSSDRRFMCQASSLDFLATQGFDFNRFIYDGIPYVQLHERDCHLQDLGLYGFTPSPSGEDTLHPPAAAAAALDDFATTGGFSQILELIRSSAKPVVLHNGVADLVYTLQQFACPLPEQWDDFKPLAQSWFTGGVYDTKVLAGQLMGQLHVPGLFGDLSLGHLHRTLRSDGAVEALLQAQAQAQGQGPEVQLPHVAHAPGFSLYPSADAASASAHGVAAVEPSCMMSSSSAASSCPSSPAPSSPVASSRRPAAAPRSPGHSQGADAAAHEAGYDAFLTGAVFARLARAAELLLPSPSSPDAASPPAEQAPAPSTVSPISEDAPCPSTPPPPAPSPPLASTSDPASPLASLRPWQGRLHSMRADLPYLNLLGTDPVPQRPNVFFLSNLDLRTKVSLVTSRFGEAGLGRVRVTMLGQPGESSSQGPKAGPSSGKISGAVAAAATKSAFVQLLSPELAELVLPAIKGMGVAWRAVPYAEYHAAKHQLQQQCWQQQQQQPQTQQQQQQQQQKYTLVKVVPGSKARGGAVGGELGQSPPSKGKTAVVSRAGGDRVIASVLEVRREGQLQAAGGQAGPAASGGGGTKFITVVRRVAVPQSALQPLGLHAGEAQQDKKRGPAAASCSAAAAAAPSCAIEA